jgi:hypothetical protein
MGFLRSLVEWLWLRSAIAVLRVRIAYLDWRLRRHGIDPDSIPEIQELRRRHEAERRQLRDSWRQLH